MLCTMYDIVYHQLYCHTASVARHIYLRPGAGVGAMQKIYGGELRIDVHCGIYAYMELNCYCLLLLLYYKII